MFFFIYVLILVFLFFQFGLIGGFFLKIFDLINTRMRIMLVENIGEKIWRNVYA